MYSKKYFLKYTSSSDKLHPFFLLAPNQFFFSLIVKKRTPFSTLKKVQATMVTEQKVTKDLLLNAFMVYKKVIQLEVLEKPFTMILNTQN